MGRRSSGHGLTGGALDIAASAFGPLPPNRRTPTHERPARTCCEAAAQQLARPMRETSTDRDAWPRSRLFHALEHHH
jgi:hypothetical protein